MAGLNSGDKVYGFVGQSMGGPKSASQSTGLQPETVAYLARFSTQPSDTFKTALNGAVVRWKNAGLLSLVQDLYLMCADAQADGLRNFVSSSRDATVTGAPVFTALKGFSSLSTSNYVSLPFSSTGIVNATSVMGAAGKFDGQASQTAAANRQLTNATFGDFGGLVCLYSAPGSVVIKGVLPTQCNGNANACSVGDSVAVSPFVVGYGGFSTEATVITPSAIGLVVGAIAGGAIKTPLLMNNSGASTILTQISAYFVAPTMSTAQLRLFLSILQGFLDDVGALS